MKALLAVLSWLLPVALIWVGPWVYSETSFDMNAWYGFPAFVTWMTALMVSAGFAGYLCGEYV